MNTKTMGLLALVCTCTSAQAQSTVSLTGTVDLYLNRATGSLTNKTGMLSGGNTTSKLVFRGNEDLGGGLRAGFWLEAGINATNGMGHATNTNNQPSGAVPAGGIVFNRRSIVYLGGDWGIIEMGRDWSPTYETFTGKYDPLSLGSGVGINYINGLSPTNVRSSNAVAYITPKFFGLSANVQHWFGENPRGTATSNDGNGDGIRLNYDSGAFSAGASFVRTTFAAGDALYRNVAAAYDFGPVRISGNYNRDRRGAVEQNGALVGAIVPIGVNEVRASYSFLRRNTAGDPKAEKLALGYIHNLSKRTAWYATAAHIRNSNGSNLAFTGATTGANHSSSSFDLGIRHNF